MTSKIKTTPKMRTAPQKNHKNVEDPLNGDDPQIKGKLKNEDNPKNLRRPQNENDPIQPWSMSLPSILMNAIKIVLLYYKNQFVVKNKDNRISSLN